METRKCVTCSETESAKWYSGPSCRKCYRRNQPRCRARDTERRRERIASEPGYKEHLRELSKSWRQNNREKSRELCRRHQSKARLTVEYKERSKLKKREIKSRYSFTKGFCKRTGREFALTLEEYAKIITSPCTYCGKSMSEETGVGLDRIDNDSRRYDVTTVLPCCGSCNMTRGDRLTVEEMKVAMDAVLAYRKRA